MILAFLLLVDDQIPLIIFVMASLVVNPIAFDCLGKFLFLLHLSSIALLDIVFFFLFLFTYLFIGTTGD
jgi:hypothetical protein